MTRSLSVRLTAMFAVCGAAVFLIGALLLHSWLERSLSQQIRNELTLRAALVKSMVLKAQTPEQWGQMVTPKLDYLVQQDSGILVWVFSDQSAFRYGGEQVGAASLAKHPGFGSLQIEGHPCEHFALAEEIPGAGDRPSLSVVVAKDPIPFWQTLRDFRIALVAALLAGVVLVGGLGYWITRLGLQPLRLLSQQAQVLNPNRPSQRLELYMLPTELLDLTTSFNGALERLEHSYRKLEAFNADVAHELRTPLMNLIGQTQVMLTRPRPPEELEDAMRSNLEDLERLRAIVNDMLFLARADQGAVVREGVDVSLNSEVCKVVEFLEPLMDQAGVRVNVQGDQQVYIETALLRRAVSNLLQNAIQHSEPNDEIDVQIDSDGTEVRLAVSNHGVRIEDRYLAHVFDRFYRMDSSRQNSAENHGLGLAIVKAIATMHRGRVFARSEGGRNTFGFSIACQA